FDSSRATNSEEAKAITVIRGMKAALGRGMERVMVLTDCRRLVSTFETRSAELSWGVLTLAPEMLAIAGRFEDFRFQYFSRCFNFEAHALASLGVRSLALSFFEPAGASNLDIEAFESVSPSSKDAYVPLLIRMLGIDNDPLDREQAIVALWKYSEGGKNCIDKVVEFHGCINLIINLLRSDSSSTCEAAAGVLRTICSLNLHRDLVAESGSIEEITSLLSRPSLTAKVKEQSISVLWNLSVDEKHRAKIANTGLLSALISFLDDDGVEVKEAAGGVLANLALSQFNHGMMVEAGVISKMVKLLKNDVENSKITKKEAKNALLELAKDELYRTLIMEEGMVLVPIVGAAAYKSFRPVSHSRPSLADGSEFEWTSMPSKYGATELLLGLNNYEKNFDIEESKINAMVARTQQQFLARLGAIEMEDCREPSEVSTTQRSALLPWVDGVARLVLILELEDVAAISRAALSIADASINEHMRSSFMIAGAVKHLVRLLSHNNDNVRLAVCQALDRLSFSNDVCHNIEAEGAVYPLVNAVKCKEIPGSLTEKTVNLLARILDPGKEIKSKFYDEPVNGLAEASCETTVANVMTAKPYERILSKATIREAVLDAGFVSRVIEILKTSSQNLQRKTLSILEYIAIVEPCMSTVIAADVKSGLDAVFCQTILTDDEDDIFSQKPELSLLEAEESGLAISAASRLLERLLESEQFRGAINSRHFTEILRRVLKSDIPLHHKDWVAACLVKLDFLSNFRTDLGNLINMEVTLYETIPRLVEQIKTPLSLETKEAAVVELNSIISKGVVDFTKAIAAQGGIFPLIKVIEVGNGRAVEASLTILFNLSMDDENHSAIIAAGAVPALRRIVFSQGPEWKRALHLLRTLPAW
ncbi:hypothetical protein GIB67_006084, partial [Kingdonia uniflora]